MPVYPGRRAGTYRVTIWSRGRQHEWIIEATKAAAKEFEATKRIALRAQPVTTTRSAPSFSTFAESYAVHAAERLGKRTWYVRKYQIGTIVAFFGAKRVDALSLAEVEAYKSTRLRTGMKASSVNNELRVLGTMLRWGREVERIAIPTIEIARLTQERPRVSAWTRAETSALLVAARAVTTELAEIVTFMINTGVRKGEAIAARWTWIDFDRGMLRIPVSAEWSPKDHAAREVPLPPSLVASLRRRASSPERHPEFLFPTRHGAPRLSFPQDLFKRAVKAAKLTGNPHKTRHTFASLFLAGRPDLVLLASLLGHSQTTVTERYAHMLPDHLDRARGVVDISSPGMKPWRPTLAEARPVRRSPKKQASPGTRH